MQKSSCNCLTSKYEKYLSSLTSSTICCLLELLQNLETALNIDASTSAISAPSPNVISATTQLFNYITTYMGNTLFVSVDGSNSVNIITSESNIIYYGIYQYLSCNCIKYQFHIRECVASVTNGSIATTVYLSDLIIDNENNPYSINGVSVSNIIAAYIYL